MHKKILSYSKQDGKNYEFGEDGFWGVDWDNVKKHDKITCGIMTYYVKRINKNSIVLE